MKHSLKNPNKILMYINSQYLKASTAKLGAAKGSISVVPINFRIRELLSTGRLQYA